MIDNTHVVVASGTGRDMVSAPEMAAFAERFGFVFRAHEKGDANRSARVERPFHFIEHNFLAGRSFADFDDLNRQALDFCDRVNAKHRRHLHGSARELFAAERPISSVPSRPSSPRSTPCITESSTSRATSASHRHRYSVPYALIGRQIEIRETKDRIDVYLGPRLVASHAQGGRPQQRAHHGPEHRPRARRGAGARSRLRRSRS